MFLQKCVLFISGEAFIDCVTNCTRLKHWKIKMEFIKFRRNSSRHPDCFLWNFLHAFASRRVVEKIFISKLKTQHISENGSSLLPRKKKRNRRRRKKAERRQRKEMMMIWIVSIAFSSSFSRNWNVNKWEEIYWKEKCVWHGKRLMEEAKRNSVHLSVGERKKEGEEEKRKNCIRNGRN